jgi:hypothetical protein
MFAIKGEILPPPRRPALRIPELPVLQHTRLQPLPYLPNDAPVRDPVLDELHQPLVVDGIEEPTNVGIKHPAHLSRPDFHRNRASKPETFNFLGFTHVCAMRRDGRFTVLRRTMRTRMLAKLRELKVEMRRRLHDPVPEVAKWLGEVLRGHYQYYGVPMNSRSLSSFHHRLVQLWFRTLRRRSQKHRRNWERMSRLVNWLPKPCIVHPYPNQRLCVTTSGRSRMR